MQLNNNNSSSYHRRSQDFPSGDTLYFPSEVNDLLVVILNLSIPVTILN